MKLISLDKGLSTIVDDDDYDFLMQWKWHAHQEGNKGDYYARCNQRINGITGCRMHRLIMKAPDGKFIDHINHNTLNNQKSNLRICTFSENLWNTFPKASTGYKGVSYHYRTYADGTPYRVIRSGFSMNGKHIYLGYFKTEEEAARAYDAAIVKYHGDFAFLNFPEDDKRGIERATQTC